MSSKCIDFLYVIKSTIVNDCFVICVGLFLLSKTEDMTYIIMYKYKMSLNKFNVYHIGFSLSFIWLAFSAALFFESFFILGWRGGPLSTVGLH